MAVVQREVKKRRHTAEQYTAGGRPELAAKENAEILVLETFLPKPLSPEELEPPLSGKLKLVDAETGESCVRFVGDEERAEYRRLLADHCAAWKKWCFDREINYLRCASSTPLEEVVHVYLREAGVLE